MKLVKKFAKAVLITYGFIFAMFLGLIVLINMLIYTIN